MRGEEEGIEVLKKNKEETETKLVAVLVGWDGEIRRMEVTEPVFWKFKNIGSGTESVYRNTSD